MTKVTKLLAVTLCGSMIFTGCGGSTTTSDNSTDHSSKAVSESQESKQEVNIGTREKETFGDGTKEYKYQGFKFSVPISWGDADPDDEQWKRWDISDNNKFEVTKYFTSTDVSDSHMMSDIIDDLVGPKITDSGSETVKENPSPTNVKQFSVGSFDATSFEVTIKDTNDYDDIDTMPCYVTYIVNTKEDELDAFILAETNTARYSYKNDYYKVIKSLTTA